MQEQMISTPYMIYYHRYKDQDLARYNGSCFMHQVAMAAMTVVVLASSGSLSSANAYIVIGLSCGVAILISRWQTCPIVEIHSDRFLPDWRRNWRFGTRTDVGTTKRIGMALSSLCRATATSETLPVERVAFLRHHNARIGVAATLRSPIRKTPSLIQYIGTASSNHESAQTSLINSLRSAVSRT